MAKTEFFDIAAQQGFYGMEKGGLYGKKDNARKYWEDISIKVNLRPLAAEILGRKGKLRAADLGCGSGEGYNLLTKIPYEDHANSPNDFILSEKDIELYLGVDISAQMIAEGIKNLGDKNNAEFMQSDLSHDFSFLERGPFDLIFSTYSSPSHLTADELMKLLLKISETHADKVYVMLDLFGMYSPEWPGYWGKESPEMKEYNMAWLHLPERRTPNEDEYYRVKYWDAAKLSALISEFAKKVNRNIRHTLKDRSILTGRHIDTGIYNNNPMQLRLQVNRLFDRDYRGEYDSLYAEISFLDNYTEAGGEAYNRIRYYSGEWNKLIDYTKALVGKDDALIKEYIETAPDILAEEMKMLAWLVRNAKRFPVVDFWASIYGPQLAAILRNMEFTLPEGLGCGHGLMCNIEIE